MQQLKRETPYSTMQIADSTLNAINFGIGPCCEGVNIYQNFKKSVLEDENTVKSGFYGGSNFFYFGIPGGF